MALHRVCGLAPRARSLAQGAAHVTLPTCLSRSLHQLTRFKQVGLASAQHKYKQCAPSGCAEPQDPGEAASPRAQRSPALRRTSSRGQRRTPPQARARSSAAPRNSDSQERGSTGRPPQVPGRNRGGREGQRVRGQRVRGSEAQGLRGERVRGQRLRGERVRGIGNVEAAVQQLQQGPLSDAQVDQVVAQCRLNTVHLSQVMAALARMRRPQLVHSVLRAVRSQGRLRLDAYHYGAAINAYKICGLWKDAYEVYLEMKADGVEANRVIFNSLISACELQGQTRHAFAVVEEMVRAKVKPDIVTMNALITITCEAGDWRRGVQLLESLPRLGLEADQLAFTCYNSLLDALWRGDQHQRALELLGAAVDEGVFPAPAASQRLLDLHRTSPGAAQGMLILWLLEIKQELQITRALGVSNEGTTCKSQASSAGYTPKSRPNSSRRDTTIDDISGEDHGGSSGSEYVEDGMYVIVTGWGRHSRDQGYSQVQQGVMELVEAMGLPFHKGANPGRLACRAAHLTAWLEGPSGTRELDLMLARAQC